MEAKRFIGEVLDDGHLSLPDDTARQVGRQFEVILLPIEETETTAYTEALARQKGFDDLTEEDVARIIHESRGVR